LAAPITILLKSVYIRFLGGPLTKKRFGTQAIVALKGDPSNNVQLDLPALRFRWTVSLRKKGFVRIFMGRVRRGRRIRG